MSTLEIGIYEMYHTRTVDIGFCVQSTLHDFKFGQGYQKGIFYTLKLDIDWHLHLNKQKI